MLIAHWRNYPRVKSITHKAIITLAIIYTQLSTIYVIYNMPSPDGYHSTKYYVQFFVTRSHITYQVLG